MCRHDLYLAVAAAAIMGGALMIGAGGARASDCANLNLSQCESTCGTAGVSSCTKTGSSVDCVCNTTTKDVNGNAYGTATTDTSGGQGNLDNKTTGPTCTGNQGQCK